MVDRELDFLVDQLGIQAHMNIINISLIPFNDKK